MPHCGSVYNETIESWCAMQTIGPRITSAREALGYTQAQLAERVPCNPQTVSNWETGRRQPRYADLVRLAEVLGRRVSWFLGEEQPDGGWQEVAQVLGRAELELAQAGRLLASRAAEQAPASTGDQLVPIAGVVEAGPLSALARQPSGWRLLPADLAAGTVVYRVEGDTHHPLLQHGDLIGLAPATEAAPGRLVAVRLAGGAEILKRLGLDGALESVNPSYAPLHDEAYELTGVVRWQLREHEASADTAALASGRLAWVRHAETNLERLIDRIETGGGQWTEVTAQAQEVYDTAEALRGVYGASVAEPAGRALSRTARALGEQGQYGPAREVAERAESLFRSVEQVGERSRDALNNLYNLSQLELFLGALDEAEEHAEQAAQCADWQVRWKALKNLAEIRVNFRGRPDAAAFAEVLALADAHEAEDPVEANLARALAHELRGHALFLAGRLTEARDAASGELAAAQAAGLPYRIANAWLNAAQYANAAGDPAAAAAACVEAGELTIGQDLGDLEAMRRAHLAAAEALRGAFGRARVALFGAVRLAGELVSPRAALMAELAGVVLANQAGDLLAREDHAAAARAAARRMGLVPYEAVIERTVAGRGI